MIEQISPSPALDRSLDRSTFRSRYTRYFFVGMGWNFILMVLLGFIPDYLIMYTGNQHAHWFSHLHGALMSLWLILFLVQATLVVKNNLKYHRQLGQASVVLGVIVWISMFVVSIRPKIAFPSPLADENWDLVLIQLFGIVFFGLFFAWGIVQRKNSSIHKRLLLLAVIAIMQAAVDRIIRFLPGLPLAFFVRFIYLDFLLVPLMIYDLFTIKRIHTITWVASALMIAGQLVMSAAAGTPTWKKIAFGMFAPFVDPVVEVTLTHAQLAPLLGNYGDKNWNVTVSHSDGKTFLKLPDVPIFEMGAISETEFLLKTMTWKVTFVKAANGEVTKIINTEPTVTWELPRMK